MGIAVNITRDSIGLNTEYDGLLIKLQSAGELVTKLNSEFVTFYQSANFNELDPTFYTRYNSYELGVLLRAIFDEGIGQATTSNNNEESINNILQTNSGIDDEIQHLVLSINEHPFVDDIAHLVVVTEKNIVFWASNLLKTLNCDDALLGEYLESSFTNLLYYKDFNSLSKVKGGFQNFQKEIVNFLHTLNFFELNDGSIQEEINEINAKVTHVFCEEGGAKSKRAQGELKREFIFENIKYSNVNCEFHYKLENIDDHKGGEHFKNRIYVGFIKSGEFKKIGIAHIGFHL
jgi:hypothetical protein